MKVLKLEIKRLFAFTKRFSKKSEEIQEVKIHEEIVDSSNIPDKTKFKCDLCAASFKKEITLQKHKNTKHDPNYFSPNKKIGKGKFGFAFDVRNCKETEAEALRLKWSQQNKDENNITEKEKYVEDEKNEQDDNENSENEEKCKESEMVDF